MAGAQTKSTESNVIKVANVSVYSDTYKYAFGNPIKLNGNRKSGFASGVMSFFIPGLGQFYNGDDVGGTTYVLASVLAKIWLMYPPKTETTYGNGNYSYTVTEGDYTAPVIANVIVAIASAVDAIIMSKRVNKARDGYRLSGNSYLKVEPTVMSSTPSLNYSCNDLAYGLNCSLKF
ncbi:MAG: hypothetical protein R3Y38_07865 [Rikenellaceae bacterium]